MKRVILESPYAGDRERNEKYAKDCMLDSLNRGEAPFVSQLLYTQVLDDDIPQQRDIGMAGHHAWQEVSEYMVVYEDYGISGGMKEAIDMATESGLPVVYRRLPTGK